MIPGAGRWWWRGREIESRGGEAIRVIIASSVAVRVIIDYDIRIIRSFVIEIAIMAING